MGYSQTKEAPAPEFPQKFPHVLSRKEANAFRELNARIKFGQTISSKQRRLLSLLAKKSRQRPDDQFRHDTGIIKGPGFQGSFTNPEGQDVSEFSVGIPINGQETNIPSIVEDTTPEEINSIVNSATVPESAMRKAQLSAENRIGQGQSPFLEIGEREVEPTPNQMMPLTGTNENSIGQTLGELSSEARSTRVASALPPVQEEGITTDTERLQRAVDETQGEGSALPPVQELAPTIPPVEELPPTPPPVDEELVSQYAQQYGSEIGQDLQSQGLPFQVEGELPEPTDITTPLDISRKELREGMVESFVPGLERVGKDYVNLVKGLYEDPGMAVDIAKELGKMGLGGIQKLIPGEQASEESFNQIANHLKERYGSIENFKRTLATDSGGVAALLAELAIPTGLVSKPLITAGKKAVKTAIKTSKNIADIPLETAIKKVSSSVIRDTTTGVGKRMGSNLYVHKSAEGVIPNIAQARKVLPEKFEYDVIRYNKKDGSTLFIKSPDFDTATEPIAREAWKVTKSGEVKRVANINQLYHHKWTMVNDDYKGFNVTASKQRSLDWLSLKKEQPDLFSKSIGRPDVWNKIKSKIKTGSGKEAVDTGLGKAVVATKTEVNDKFIAKLENTAGLQRGLPEAAMRDINKAQISQVYGHATEHVGDIINRMSDSPLKKFGGADAIPKIENMLSFLKNDYGFERELKEQIISNLKFAQSEGRELGETVASKTAQLKRLSQKYADEHKKLPVHNEAQRLAQEAAVSLGEWRFADTVKALEKLAKHTGSRDEWAKFVTASDVAKSGKAVAPAAVVATKTGKKTVAEKADDELFKIFDNPENLQKITSRGTDLKQRAAGFNKIKAKGETGNGVDIGGGRGNKAGKNIDVIDPFNRPRAKNLAKIEEMKKNPRDFATIFNVLNVIPEDKNIINAIKQADRLTKSDGKIYIQVHTGSGKFPKGHPKAGKNRAGSGIGSEMPTKKRVDPNTGKIVSEVTWQRNQKLSDYEKFVKEALPDARILRKGDDGYIPGMMTIRKSGGKFEETYRKNLKDVGRRAEDAKVFDDAIRSKGRPSTKAEKALEKEVELAAQKANVFLPEDIITLPRALDAKNWLAGKDFKMLTKKTLEPEFFIRIRGGKKVKDPNPAFRKGKKTYRYDNALDDTITALQEDSSFQALGIFDRANVISVLQRSQKKNVFTTSKKLGQNNKLKGTDIIEADTIRGCGNNCFGCYACKLSAIGKINFETEVPAIVEGIIKAKQTWRVGVSGDPAANWAWTVKQAKAVLARSPGKTAADDIVFISKLQKIDGFDPNIIQNLQISLDIMNPAQMEVTMQNLRILKKKFPEMFKRNKLELRIRTVASKNKALMSVQERAIKFSHEMKIATNETPMRFKSANEMKVLEVINDKYVLKNSQFQLPDKNLQAKRAYHPRRCGKSLGGDCKTCEGCPLLAKKGAGHDPE